MDKNWVFAPGELLHTIATEFELLFSDVLFYELLTTTPAEMTRCFRNLVGLKSSLLLIPNLGRLLRYENSTQQACTPLAQNRFVIPIRVNPRSGEPDYPFSEKQRAVIELESARREHKDPLETQEILAGTPGWFPALKQIKPGSKRPLIAELEQHIASDDSMIKAIYGAIRHPPMPPATTLSADWAYYRRMQVYLLAGVDYCWRHGPGYKDSMPKNFANQCLDLEYLIIGLLADAFLTHENRLRRWYLLLKPAGRLLPASYASVKDACRGR